MTNALATCLALYPRSAPYRDALLRYCAAVSIDTPERVAAFVAQVAHESGQFRYAREIWGPTAQQRKYEPPSKLAKVLGNTRSGDGKRYMGRGLIQVTGRANYRACGHEEDPEKLATPDGAAWSAVWFWRTRNLNALADAGDFLRITKRINGGTNGYDERCAEWAKCKAVLGI